MDNSFWVAMQDVSSYWKGFREDKWGPTLNALPYCAKFEYKFEYNFCAILGFNVIWFVKFSISI